MPVKAFVDTHVLIYAVAEGDPRSAQAEELLASGGVLSVQVPNEFVSVARRKILMSWSDVTQALRIAPRHGHNIHGALVIAAASEAGCATLHSEDLHDGQTIDGQLTIRNRFAELSRNEFFSRVTTLY
jgi:predicted nucleic acid-binding protein